MKILISHIPVIHSGYLAVFKKYAETVDMVYILSEEFVNEFSDIRDIRALRPCDVIEAMKVLVPMRWARRVYRILTRQSLSEIKR